jgi:hypothetical protein
VSRADLPSPILWRSRQIEAHLVLRPKQEIVVVILRPKSPN